MSHQAFRGVLLSLAAATSRASAGYLDLLGSIHRAGHAAEACLALGSASHAR
jgi:hypothetical protein